MSFNFAAYERIEIPEGRVKQIARASDGVVLWTAGYVNQVPLSIDTDGSIFNDTGYQEGYRLSSSGALKAQTNSVVTGFIPATIDDVIRMKGAKWGTTVSSGYCYIMYYDSDKTVVGSVNAYMDGGENGIGNRNGITYVSQDDAGIIADENGVYTFDINFKDGSTFSYIRISTEGIGADMIVTVNEEIPPSLVNLVPTSIDTDGSIYNGVGYIEGYRLSSSGSLSAQDNTVTTGYIPFKQWGVVKLSGVDWFNTSGGHTYLAFYDSSFTLLGSINCYADTASASGYYSVARGVVQFVDASYSDVADLHPTLSGDTYIFDQISFSDGMQIAYCRINGLGKGADMVVRV